MVGGGCRGRREQSIFHISTWKETQRAVRNSNRVRCTTPTHGFNCPASGGRLQEAMQLAALDMRNPLISAFANRTLSFLRGRRRLHYGSRELNARTTIKAKSH